MTFNQEDIERYLSQDLDEIELSNFEKELRINRSLKEQVLLSQELNDIFYDNDQISFINNLKEIEYKGAAHTSSTQPKNKFLGTIGVLIASLLLGLAGYYVLGSFPPNTQLPTIAPETQNVDEEEDLEKPKIEYALEEAKPVLPAKPEPTDDIAFDYSTEAQFLPNPDIEALISHANENNWIISHFPLDQFAQPNEFMTLAFNGQLKSNKGYVDKDIAFYLFNNDVGAYQNFVPYKTYYPKINEVQFGFEIDLDEELVLEEGLYYYLIEEVKSEEVLYAGKFESRVSNLF